MTKSQKLVRVVGLCIIAGMLHTGALCQRTIQRDGVRMTVEEAETKDLARARIALSEENYDEAISIYLQFSEEFPKSDNTALVMVKTGEAYYKKGEYEWAKDEFNEVLVRFSKSPEAADAAWGLALLSFREGDCAGVEGIIKEHRDRDQGSRWDAMTSLMAECEFEHGDRKKALEHFGEEARKGRDKDFRKKARARAELLVKEVKEPDLEDIAKRFRSAFPGDLVLIELIGRAIEGYDLDRALLFVGKFEERFGESDYLPEFEKLKKHAEQWSKVKPNRIGVMLPLSGNLSGIGEQALQGIMLAASIFDEGEPILPAELVIKDTGDDRVPIEDIVEGLVNEDFVIAIVGPLRSQLAERAAVKAQELGVPLVTLSPRDGLAKRGDMIYQNSLTKSEQVEALADYAVLGKKMTGFSVLYPDDDYGRDFLGLFSRAVAERGGSVGASQSYALDDTDFRKEIWALKRQRSSSPFQAILIPDSYVRVAMIAPQIRYCRLSKISLLGINGWHSEELLVQTQPVDIEGAVFTDAIAPEARLPGFNIFTRRFRAEYEDMPGLMEAQAYESVDLLLYVIQTYRVRDREQLKQALDHIKDYPGVLGLITVDDDGKWKKPVYLFMINDGMFNVISKYK